MSNLDSEINEILFPIYNYGWPGTGMPGTQKKMSHAEAKQAITALIKQREVEARIKALVWAIEPDGVANIYERIGHEIHLLTQPPKKEEQ